MQRFLIAILCSSLFFYSCTSLQFDADLLEVESYIQDLPDSALATLVSMNPQKYKSRNDKSLHALLHAMALDKTFVDVDDDSLANVALEYFGSRGPKKYKARSLYYRGLSHYYAHNNDMAVLDFTKAEQVCLECGDSLYLAMTYVCFADVYGSTYNDIEEINYLNKALDLFTTLGREYHVDVVKRRLGSAYSNSRQFDEAERILCELIQKDKVDDKVKALAMSSYAYLQMIKPEMNPALANCYYNKVDNMGYSDFISLRGYWAWAAAMSMMGMQAESQMLVEQLLPISESYISDYWRYIICKNEGDNISALQFYEKSGESSNDEIEKTLRQSVAIYQRDFYHAQATLEAYKVKSRTKIFGFMLLVLFLVLVFALYIIGERLKAIKKEKEDKVNFAERLIEQLSYEQNEKSELRKKYISLHQAKYDIICRLCEQYYTLENRVDVEKLMLKNVSSLIDSIRCDENTHVKFERMLNNERDNIVRHLKIEMPRLKPIDYALFCYYVVGFDAMTAYSGAMSAR